jgi:hypothetical protein
MPSLPITFIKQDSNSSSEFGTYAIKQTSQQNLFGGSLIKSDAAAAASENSLNFKNLQKNLDLIDQQHLGFRPQQGSRFVAEESDDEEEGALIFEDDDDDDITLSPLEWDCNDVIDFLKRSNCSQYCETFMKHKIDGKKLLQLTQNDIIQMLGMKVGPAIKIYDLIQQIKVKVAPFMGIK